MMLPKLSTPIIALIANTSICLSNAYDPISGPTNIVSDPIDHINPLTSPTSVLWLCWTISLLYTVIARLENGTTANQANKNNRSCHANHITINSGIIAICMM